jgi:hypothetical protein
MKQSIRNWIAGIGDRSMKRIEDIVFKGQCIKTVFTDKELRVISIDAKSNTALLSDENRSVFYRISPGNFKRGEVKHW